MALKKQRTVGYYLSKGINPVGLHVEHNGKLGTVKAVMLEPVPHYASRLIVQHFNGEPWEYQPLPAVCNVIERAASPIPDPTTQTTQCPA